MTDALKEKNSKALIFYLIFTAMVCGALVMVVEVMGSRVIGPFFGVSLFVWTSLITVTLVMLALGYALGGIISDKKRTPDYLYAIILMSGLLVMLVPHMKGAVLKACMSLGLRFGALTSSLILFGPSLFLLGCVSPYIIKIAARELKNIGKTVGVFYAISTIGSFIGTVLTGFVLIAYFGVNRIFEVAGFILICLSVFYFIFFRKKWYFFLFLIISFFLFHTEAYKSKVLSNGTKITEVFSKDGFYGRVKVVDYSYEAINMRELIIDGLPQGGIDVNNRLPVYKYLYYMEFLPYLLNPEGKKCLVIGLGAGVVPVWYEKMGIRTDVVEINHDMVDIARKYFGFGISGDIIISDARYYLNNPGKNYDYVILDVFNGDTTPGHILSIETLKLIRNRLTDQGILAINMLGSLKRETFMTASIIKTLEQVFSTVEIYPLFSLEGEDGYGNLAVVAYNRPLIKFNSEAVDYSSVHPLAVDEIRERLKTKFYFSPNTPAIILSDDYNPIDFYDIWLRERIRKNIIEATDWDILI